MEEKIVHTALENLQLHTGIEGLYTPNNKKGLDGEVRLLFQKEQDIKIEGKEIFNVEIRREIRNHQLKQIKDWAETNKNFLLIAETIFPKIKEELRKNGIGYLDTAGNIFLKTAKHHVWIEGHKKEKLQTNKKNRAFTATGLKVIYLFLLDEKLLNQPQRIIAEVAEVALGNINYIINGLKQNKFLIETDKKKFQLINKDELLQKWINGFEEKLKPTLHIGNYRFIKNEDERNWMKLNLKTNHTFWGGEPAGAIITKYLTPEIFTIYTDETRNNFIKNYHFVPEPKGNIKVYRKFWNENITFNGTTVNPILAYTDLINTGNTRCIETAKIIYGKYIKPNL